MSRAGRRFMDRMTRKVMLTKYGMEDIVDWINKDPVSIIGFDVDKLSDEVLAFMEAKLVGTSRESIDEMAKAIHQYSSALYPYVTYMHREKPNDSMILGSTSYLATMVYCIKQSIFAEDNSDIVSTFDWHYYNEVKLANVGTRPFKLSETLSWLLWLSTACSAKLLDSAKHFEESLVRCRAKLEAANNKASKQSVVYKEKVVKVADDDELAKLQDTITDLSYQLDVARAICSDRGKPVELSEQEEELTAENENEQVDLSKYKILIITAYTHSKCFDYDCLDLMAKPESISRLRNYDIVVFDTKHMSHSAYYSAKTVCQNNGVKFVHYGKRDKKLLNALIASTIKSCKI